MPKFKHYDYNQTAMVVINYQDQLQPGTFEHALHYLISEKLDLSAFHQPYKNDTEGRPAYDPAILKLRWGRGSKGKSGGVRVIYYYHDQRIPLYLLTMFGKGERANLSKADRNALSRLVSILVHTALEVNHG